MEHLARTGQTKKPFLPQKTYKMENLLLQSSPFSDFCGDPGYACDANFTKGMYHLSLIKSLRCHISDISLYSKAKKIS